MLADSASPAPDTVSDTDHELIIITAVCSTLISVSGLIMAAMLCSWCFGQKKYESDEEESLNEYKPVAYGGEDSNSIRDGNNSPNHSPSHNGSTQSRASSTQHLTAVGNKKSSRFDRHKTVTEHVQPLNNTNQVAHMVTEDTVAFTQQKEETSKEMEVKARSHQNQRRPFIPIDTQTRSLQNQQHLSFDSQDITSKNDCPKSNQRKGSMPILVSHKQPKQDKQCTSIPIEMKTLDTQHINNQEDCTKESKRKGSAASIKSLSTKACNIFAGNESKKISEQCVIEKEVPCTSSLIPQTNDIENNSNPGGEANNMKLETEHSPLPTTSKSSWHRITKKLPLIVAHKRPKKGEQHSSIPIEMAHLGLQDITSQEDSPKSNQRKGSLASIQDKAYHLFGLHERKKSGEQCVIEQEVPGTSFQTPQTKGGRKNTLPTGGTNNMKSKDNHPLPSKSRSLWRRVKLKLPLILALRHPKKEYSPRRRASMFASREDFLRQFSLKNDPQQQRKSHPNKNDTCSRKIFRRFSLGNQPMMKVERPESPAQVSNVQQLISMFKEKIQEETTKPARQLRRESRHKVKRLKRKYLEQEKMKRYANSPFYVASSQSAEDEIPTKSADENVSPEKTELTEAQEKTTQRVINNLRRGSRVMTEEQKQTAYVNLIKRRREVQRMRKQYMQRTGHSVEVDSYECDPPIPADVSL